MDKVKVLDKDDEKRIKQSIQDEKRTSETIHSDVRKIISPYKPLFETSGQILSDINDEFVKIMHDIIIELEKVNTHTRKIRGNIISDMIDLESRMDSIILAHYVKPEHREMFLELLAKESFNLMFKKVALDKSGLLEPYDSLSYKLEFLIQVRNTIAHQKIIFTDFATQKFKDRNIVSLQSLEEFWQSELAYCKDKFNNILANIQKDEN